MKRRLNIDRRQFIKTSAVAGSALVLAFYLPDSGLLIAKTREKKNAEFSPNGYLRIDQTGKVTITVTRSEMGQGVRTSLPMILAEELEADWSKITIEQASTAMGFKSLNTGGSWSVGGNWAPLRKAGAAAREMLISVAAAKWSVEPALCVAENGFVLHTATGRRVQFGALVDAASRLPVPANPRLKDPKDFRLIGQRMKRLDGPSIISGKAVYGIDTVVPGMRYATILRSPYFGGKVSKWDGVAARAVEGVKAVVEITNGIAVVAESRWAALKGRDALSVTWDQGKNHDYSTETFWTNARTESDGPGHNTRLEGKGKAALGDAHIKLEATYQYPFQAHAPVEPANCVASVHDDKCEIWAPTQAPDRVRTEVAKVTGFDPSKVTVHVTLMGGGFGRRLGADYAVEAAELSNIIKEPVQVLWTRVDDMQNGYFQPASLHRMQAGLGDDLRPLVWSHKKAGIPAMVIASPPTKEELESPGYYQDVSWGAYDVPYSFPNIETSYCTVTSPVPIGPWRSVYSPSCTFARECFLDELAHAAKQDPLKFRLGLLEKPEKVKVGDLTLDRTRLSAVLRLAAEKADWGKKMPKGWGQGIACNIYDGETCLAYVVEVSVAANGNVRVHRVVCAVDCGIVINPEGVEAQIEGGVMFGLSTALHGEITFKGGRVEQSTYQDFEVMRMRDAPPVEVHIIKSTKSPTGMGEPPVPPIPPAVANAIFAAAGKRIRRLPIRADDLKNSNS